MFRKMTLSRQVRRLSLVGVAAGLLAGNAFVGSPASAQQEMPNITVGLTEFQFSPKTITLTVGQEIQLNIQNQGKQDHSLLSNIPLSQVHYINADNTTQELSSYEATKVLNADALSGHTSVVQFTPSKTGTFEFFSEDEEDLGLIGNFMV